MRMDGTHTIDWLFEQARARYQSLTRVQFQHFVLHLARLGLLANALPPEGENDFADETTVDPGARKWVVAEAYESIDDSSVLVPEIDDEPERTELGGKNTKGVVIEFPRPPSFNFDTNTDKMHAREEEYRPEPTVLDPADVVSNATPDQPAPDQAATIPPQLALTPHIPQDEVSFPPEPAPLVIPDLELAIPDPDPQVPGPVQEVSEIGPRTVTEPSKGLEEQPPWYLRPAYRAMRIPLVLIALGIAAALIPYPQYVTDECSVLPEARAEVRAQVDGILSTILVDEGQHVSKDDPLAELDPREIDAALSQAKAELQSLQAKQEKMSSGFRPEEIAKVEAAVRARQHDMEFARIEAQRRQRLFAQNVGSAEQRDNAQHDYEVMRSALSQAQAELRLMRAGFRQEEIKVADAEKKGAEARVAYLTEKRSGLKITSPIDGVITTPKFKEHLHKRIAAGDTVCEVADTSQVRVEIMVPEQEIDLVKVDQATVVKVRSLPLHPFHGNVTFIAPAVETQGDKRFVRTVTVIQNPDGMLHEGMSGYAEIDTGQSTVLRLALRRVVRWVRVRFLI